MMLAKERNSVKIWIKILDAIVVLSIFFNLGAVYMTQYVMGLQHNPKEVAVVEINPVVRKAFIEENEKVVQEGGRGLSRTLDIQYKWFITHCFAWGFFLWGYFSNRMRVIRNNYKPDFHFYTIMFLSIMVITLTAFDFMLDLGFVMGMLKGG